MSYILDALKRAAEQRDRYAPALRRLLAPAPTRRSAWARSPGRLLAALLLNAGLLIVLLVVWLRSVPIASPPQSVPAASPPQSVGSERQPTAEVRGVETAERERATSVESVVAPARPKERGPEPPLRRPGSTPSIASPRLATSTPAQRPPTPTAERAPQPAPTPAVTPEEPPTAPELAQLRLEALIYSDLPEKRMIFINGHKYVEGDLIEGRLRVEQIQEDSVALSEEGRRLTLRIAH